jgi:hypothetical protein
MTVVIGGSALLSTDRFGSMSILGGDGVSFSIQLYLDLGGKELAFIFAAACFEEVFLTRLLGGCAMTWRKEIGGISTLGSTKKVNGLLIGVYSAGIVVIRK